MFRQCFQQILFAPNCRARLHYLSFPNQQSQVDARTSQVVNTTYVVHIARPAALATCIASQPQRKSDSQAFHIIQCQENIRIDGHHCRIFTASFGRVLCKFRSTQKFFASLAKLFFALLRILGVRDSNRIAQWHGSRIAQFGPTKNFHYSLHTPTHHRTTVSVQVQESIWGSSIKYTCKATPRIFRGYFLTLGRYLCV